MGTPHPRLVQQPVSRAQPHPSDPCGFFPGGAIAAKFATVYPPVVERLVLMAPAGLPLPVPILGQLGSLPVIGELLFAKLARPSLHAFVRETTLSKAPKDIQETMYARMTQCLHRDCAEVRCINLLVGVCVRRDKVDAAIDLHPGMLDTLMSTVRHFPMTRMEPVFRALGHPEGTLTRQGNRARRWQYIAILIIIEPLRTCVDCTKMRTRRTRADPDVDRMAREGHYNTVREPRQAARAHPTRQRHHCTQRRTLGHSRRRNLVRNVCQVDGGLHGGISAQLNSQTSSASEH